MTTTTTHLAQGVYVQEELDSSYSSYSRRLQSRLAWLVVSIIILLVIIFIVEAYYFYNEF